MKNKIVIVTILIIGFIVGGFILLSSDESAEAPTNEPPNTKLTLSDVHGLAVDIENPEKLYIANHQGLYVQDDDGLSNTGPANDDFMSFATSPTIANLFYASGHPKSGGNIGIVKTSDGGKTCAKISDGLDGPVDFHSMTIDQKNTKLIYGIYRGRIQKSIDGGESWTYIQKHPSDIIQLSSANQENGIYTATKSGLYRSLDQGNSWELVSAEGSAVVAVASNPQSPNELIMFDIVGGFQKSSDGGESWTKLSGPFGSDIVLQIAYSRSEPTVVYMITDKLDIYKSTDGGTSWALRQ